MNNTHVVLGGGLLVGTAALAAIDGGLSHLAARSVLAAGVGLGHSRMANETVRRQRKLLKGAKVEDAEKKGGGVAGRRKHVDRAVARMSEGELNQEQAAFGVVSLGLGALTFVYPVVGLSCLAALWLGRKTAKKTKKKS